VLATGVHLQGTTYLTVPVPTGALTGSVTVTTGAQRRLAGVAATTGGGVSALAAAFARRGFADVVPDPVPAGTTPAVLAWKEP